MDQFDPFMNALSQDLVKGNNHDTFRPVSILDKGLEINEDDMMYDNVNARGTFANDYLRGSQFMRESIRGEQQYNEVYSERDNSMQFDSNQFN